MNSDDRAPTTPLTRRELLARMGTGLAVITVASAWGPISPVLARERQVPFRILTPDEVRTLEALGEVLLPGAREAGLAHYIDDQLGRETPTLFAICVDYVGPFVDFYRGGLHALDQMSAARHGRPFSRLQLPQQTALVREMAQKSPAGWNGPSASLFYLAVRNDAVDVFYGTPEGFKKLAIPYMEHLLPPRDW